MTIDSVLRSDESGVVLSALYQLPITSYHLPSSPTGMELSCRELVEKTRSETGGEKSKGDGVQPFLIESVYFSNKIRAGGSLSALHPPNLIIAKYRKKQLDYSLVCGYIYNMKDRPREKDRMIHVRFTEEERRRLKAYCALCGVSMQEYIRLTVLKNLRKKRGGG